jgi:hypothetical protein
MRSYYATLYIYCIMELLVMDLLMEYCERCATFVFFVVIFFTTSCTKKFTKAQGLFH